ncbi:MAG: TIGR00159 family protein, partial [Desulfovibrio sp.]|nr:TIGR00159 family protein [Desulfovibrio sp.]
MVFEHFVFDWRDALDIALVSLLLYQIIQLLRGSRALAVLTGLGLLTLLYFLARALGLYTLSWLLQYI